MYGKVMGGVMLGFSRHACGPRGEIGPILRLHEVGSSSGIQVWERGG